MATAYLRDKHGSIFLFPLTCKPYLVPGFSEFQHKYSTFRSFDLLLDNIPSVVLIVSGACGLRPLNSYPISQNYTFLESPHQELSVESSHDFLAPFD